MTVSLKRYCTDEGARAALVQDGRRKYFNVLMMNGGPLTVQKVPMDHARYMTDLGPVRPKHLKVFRSHGRSHGMRPSAKAFLREVSNINEEN